MTAPSEPGPSPPFERRRLVRVRATDGAARLAWRGLGHRVLKAPARLMDIHEGGARVVSGLPAQVGQTLWLGLDALPSEWVRATVRASHADGFWWDHHLVFDEPCPAGLLERSAGGDDEAARDSRSWTVLTA